MVRMPVVTRSRSPLSEMNRLARELDSVFGGVSGSNDLWSPPVDVEETGDELILTAELPGMKHEDIDIELEDGVLTIQGEKKEERKDEGTQGLLYERRWGSFTRKFTLPRAVDANNINASYENGILTIHVPKAEEAKGRKIEITAGGRDVG
ncbi:MAG: Hsp20/alpha crystallin family protein [Candidatus Longimicrobiales bacterium M2_2A_002]